ncbi:MAG TPA: sterol desaturase family protein [Acidimicrobiales bacterium]|jgi:sterol desaturase/sphingolipid hydroxylase (fatty acid hydroxylase superfamily)|nr:sterol desaturase family protein [Acidimicrobiales bacterium]
MSLSITGHPGTPAGRRDPAPNRQPVEVPARARPWAVLPWTGGVAVAVTAVWLAVVGWHALGTPADAYHALAVAQMRTVGPALLIGVALVFAVERIRPAVPRPWRCRAHLVDAAYLLLFAGMAPLVALLDTGFAVMVERRARFLLLGRLPVASQFVISIATLVGIDAVNWAAHVANHRSSVFWRFHALHHSQEDMSVFTTFRTHPLAHFSYAPALLPALILGASGATPAWTLIAYGCLVTLPHANLPWTFGPLGQIFVSPAYHRLHHATAPIGGRAVVNFGFVLSIWDRMAGLAADPAPGQVGPTGIAGRPVPIEQHGPGRSVLRVVSAQLAQPFRPHDPMGAS